MCVRSAREGIYSLFNIINLNLNILNVTRRGSGKIPLMDTDRALLCCSGIKKYSCKCSRILFFFCVSLQRETYLSLQEYIRPA